ncbi:STAS domain-containing protein [Streptomyces sp. NPDC006422]|uniref:STAS domain-containing protein n=1 Tax=unclassified Streptomyces TaxID=2593676 RepID=UPI0033AB1594
MNRIPGPTPFALSAVDAGDSVLLRVSGDLDIDSVPQLDEALARLHERNCELDLADVEFTDSTGVSLLTRHRREAVAAGGNLRLVAVTAPVRRVLDMTGTSAILLALDNPPPTDPGSAHG